MELTVAKMPAVTPSWYSTTEARFLELMTRYAPDVLRTAIGVIFVWFGVLKILGQSPAAALVRQTVSAIRMAHGPVVGMLGVIEIAIGLGLLFGVALRSTLLLFVMQQAGTFLVLIVCPEVAFQHHNPFLLTMTGEFVVKNVVLVAGGVAVVAATLEKHRLRQPSSDSGHVIEASASGRGSSDDVDKDRCQGGRVRRQPPQPWDLFTAC